MYVFYFNLFSSISSLYEQSIQKDLPKGKVIDCSMVEGSAYVSSWLWTSRSLPGIWGEPRGSNVLDGGLPQYDTYETKDGKFMSVGALEPAFYKQFLKGFYYYPLKLYDLFF